MEKNKKIKAICGFVTAIFIILSGIAFAVNATVIYKTGGTRPYNREIVGKHLLYVLPVVVPTLIAIITGIVLSFTHPVEKPKLRASKNAGVMLKRLKLTLPADFDASLYTEIAAEEKKRDIIFYSFIASASVLGILALILAIFSEYSLENINACITRSAITVISISFVIGALAYIADRLIARSTDREIDAIKNILKDIKLQRTPQKADKKSRSGNVSRIAGFAVLGIAALFLIIGAMGDGMADVLEKAVRICTECIGLG